jgi:hypothetical protein
MPHRCQSHLLGLLVRRPRFRPLYHVGQNPTFPRPTLSISTQFNPSNLRNKPDTLPHATSTCPIEKHLVWYESILT